MPIELNKAPSLSIGAVYYGVASKQWNLILMSVSRQIAEIRPAWRDDLNVNVVFHIPRSQGPISWSGVRTSSFRKRDHHLMIQVALPEEPHEGWGNSYLVERIREALDAADVWAAKRHLAVDLGPHRNVVDRIE